jgi:hypothetical protein
MGKKSLRNSRDILQLTQQPEDPVKLLQVRLAKGEITPEQYQASLKVLQALKARQLPFSSDDDVSRSHYVILYNTPAAISPCWV